jgi:long-chain-fatty-acid--[acyl-carrier-protein] ligase
VLPPFHSFGLSLTGLFPLLCGLKVFYAPDPTDSASMLLDHQTMKPTILCSAPGFLLSLFSLASKDDLQHLRLVVCGAEKTPQRLYELIEEKAMQALCLEGYGITECSPVVTLQRITQSRKGVGSALAHVDLCIVHPESLQPVLKGEEGEILIRGNAVFSGYLEETSSPFVEVEGVSWYRSGDRGYLDQEGILYLTGRLKRFVKIGGEMVSLGAIEELLLQTAQKKGWLSSSVEGVPLAVLSVEKELGRPELVVCATFPISKEEMNFALRDGGMSKIVKIHQVIPMDQIPLSGTGKIQYRLLKQELEKHAPV